MAYFDHIDINSLTDVDLTIHAYINNNMDKVPYMRIRELARESHTSSSSVMRFIRKMGFEGYSDFKYSFKKEKKEPESVSRRSTLDSNHFPEDSHEKINQVAQLILQVENVVFFGMGASGAMCDYAARRLATIGFNTHSLTDPTFPLYQKLKNTTNNVVIVLSVTGNTPEMVEAVNGYKHLDDFKIVAVTSDELSAIARLSDLVLSYTVDRTHLFQYNDMTSQLPTIFLVEELIDKVRTLDVDFN